MASDRQCKPVVAIACGQQLARGFVQVAVRRFLKENPASRARVATPRGKARIEGVAGGQFDLALVTDSPATIHQLAGREMFIETLKEEPELTFLGNKLRQLILERSGSRGT